MKRALPLAACFFRAFILAYLGAAFVQWSFDPAEWSTGARGIAVLVALGLAVAFAAALTSEDR